MSRSHNPDADETIRWTRRQILARGGALAAALLTGAAACTDRGGCNGRADPAEGDDATTERKATDAARDAARDGADASDADSPRQTEWTEIRRRFNADPDVIHMAGMLLATHPKRVREAIARHRRGLNDNPVGYLFEHWARSEAEAQLDDDGEEQAMRAAGRYLQSDHTDIALTDSTTEGLAVVYNGLDIEEDQEVLTAHWNHWATEGSIEYRAEKAGFSVRRAQMYDDLAETTRAELVDRLVDEITDQTRVVAATWVHSTTGLKLPIGRIGRRIASINEGRGERDRILFCVDGVHGFGVESFTLDQLHCDFFVAGCHKWLFGPRGTGIVAAAPGAWSYATPTVPSFSMDITQGRRFTPGGFKTYEHIWALSEAFDFHLDIGKKRISDRIHQLADHLYDGLDNLDHVRMITPADPDLRAGIITFEVDGHGTNRVIDHLRSDGIVASVTPGDLHQPRLTPGLLNDHVEIERVLERIDQLS